MRPYDERFSALLSHAARVFAGQGYDRTSMRDLAAASGMSLAGIYYYVRGKEDLLYHIQERCFTQVVDGAAAALQAAVDPEERLAAFIKHHVTFFAAHMPEMKVLSHEAQALSGDRLRKVNQIKRRYVNLLERLLKDVAPERPPLERSAATYALFGMMNWIYNWYDPAGALDSGHLADLLTRIFLGGFAEARSPVTGGS
jgi:AcrR family transcriptional regulator